MGRAWRRSLREEEEEEEEEGRRRDKVAIIFGRGLRGVERRLL